MEGWVSSPAYDAVVQTLRAERRKAKLSQRELAARLTKPRSFVSKIEGGERRVDVIEFLAILRAIHADERQAFEALINALPVQLDI